MDETSILFVPLVLMSRHLYKMVDSCRQLTVSQSNGDEDTAGMVTILTGHQVEELCTQSAAMKVGHSDYSFCSIFEPVQSSLDCV